MSHAASPRAAAPLRERDEGRAGRGRALRVFLAGWAALAALMAVWALSDPIMAGPDEPSHAIKAVAVVRGQLAGEARQEAPGFRYVQVPDWAAELDSGRPTCYAMNPYQTGDCVPDIDGSNDVVVEGRTAAGTYDPLYYALVGWPSLVLEDEAAVFGMRLASAVLCSGVLAAGLAAMASRRRASWSFAAAAVCVTPMVAFLGSHVNVSGLEAAAAFALAAWLGALVEPGRRLPLGVAVSGVALSAVLLANTRSVGPLWLAVIAVVCLLDGRIWPQLLRSWRFWAGAALIAVGGAFAAWWALSMGGGEARALGEGAGEVTFAEGFEFMLAKALDTADGYVGVFGWLDARLPATTVSVWGGLMFALVAAAILLGRGWARVRVVAMTLAYLLLPAIIQGSSWYTHGYIWQSRYIIAIVLALVVCAGSALDEAVPPLSAIPRGRTTAVVLSAGLGVMQCFALAWNLRRYVTGLDEEHSPWSEMTTDPMWQPRLGWQLVLALGVVAALAWIAVTLTGMLRGAVPSEGHRGRLDASGDSPSGEVGSGEPALAAGAKPVAEAEDRAAECEAQPLRTTSR